MAPPKFVLYLSPSLSKGTKAMNKLGKYKTSSCSSFGNKEQSRCSLAESGGGKELTGLYMKSSVNSQQSSEMAYVISDHLGSIWALANKSKMSELGLAGFWDFPDYFLTCCMFKSNPIIH